MEKVNQVAETVTVERLWGAFLPKQLGWYVVHTTHTRKPRWAFWRSTTKSARIYGNFPSRNQAEKFARVLSNPL